MWLWVTFLIHLSEALLFTNNQIGLLFLFAPASVFELMRSRRVTPLFFFSLSVPICHMEQRELAGLCARCEQYIGMQGGGMDQATSLLGSRNNVSWPVYIHNFMVSILFNSVFHFFPAHLVICDPSCRKTTVSLFFISNNYHVYVFIIHMYVHSIKNGNISARDRGHCKAIRRLWDNRIKSVRGIIFLVVTAQLDGLGQCLLCLSPTVCISTVTFYSDHLVITT